MCRRRRRPFLGQLHTPRGSACLLHPGWGRRASPGDSRAMPCVPSCATPCPLAMLCQSIVPTMPRYRILLLHWCCGERRCSVPPGLSSVPPGLSWGWGAGGGDGWVTAGWGICRGHYSMLWVNGETAANSGAHNPLPPPGMGSVPVTQMPPASPEACRGLQPLPDHGRGAEGEGGSGYTPPAPGRLRWHQLLAGRAGPGLGPQPARS